MTDGFLWGGINIRKFCRVLFRNFWMIIAIMITTYLGLDLVDKQTYTPHYTSSAVVAVYPKSSYRFHTIETVYDLSQKTEVTNSVFNSDLFQAGLHNQNPSLQDCTIESTQIVNTDLLEIYVTSGNPENALTAIKAVLDYYSQFSGSMTGAPEAKIIYGPEAPYQMYNNSKVHKYKVHLSVLSGFMMAGLLLIMYLARKTYKTERSIRRRYKSIRFFSLPLIKSASENKKGNLPKRKSQESIKKVALEIKQVLQKYNKNTLFVTSFTDKEGGTAFLSSLAGELAEQNKDVILIETESRQQDGASESDASEDVENNTFLDVLRQKGTVKDAMFYNEELKVHCIQCGMDNIYDDISISADDVRQVLHDCLDYADIVLVNGAAWFPSRYAHIWHEAVDASVALCRQDDAYFFKVDEMLSDLNKGDTYFAGCVLLGF